MPIVAGTHLQIVVKSEYPAKLQFIVIRANSTTECYL